MPIPEEFLAEANALPAPIRAILDDELAAGNQIVEVGHTHPAPACGAYFMLERQVTTHPRGPAPGVHFREIYGSKCSGEFGDETRTYFLLEPPLPPPPEPDMDAIRASLIPPPTPWPDWYK